ncbi:hypothetical protein [Streptomyces sp. Mg1]|uniref:hypothetical protein n=1 Tax=Streptomyces sp. Mg1 TaxID=465541 RepID=UPI00017E89BE|nr:hypothetical protein SSAG_06843 [Streptomyces sp. Mg1]
MSVTRRSLLAAAGVTFGGALGALFTATAGAAPVTRGYGPLLPDPDRLLDLPAGFSYRVLSRAGTPLLSRRGRRRLYT